MVGLRAHRYHTRSVCWLHGADGSTGVGFALFEQFWPLLLIAFVGTLNPSSAMSASSCRSMRFVALRYRPRPHRRVRALQPVGTLLAALGSLARPCRR
jgi:hypothetical protein